MRLEAVGQPIRYRWPGGEIVLIPGQPVEVEPDRARRILAKLGDRVRAVETLKPKDPIIIEPANPQGRPVYWERGSGEIVGPATVTYLAQVGTGAKAHFWVIVEYAGQMICVRSDRLRSKSQFENQVKPKVVELIREPR